MSNVHGYYGVLGLHAVVFQQVAENLAVTVKLLIRLDFLFGPISSYPGHCLCLQVRVFALSIILIVAVGMLEVSSTYVAPPFTIFGGQ